MRAIRQHAVRVGFVFGLVIIVVYCWFPLVWTVLTALKPETEIFRLPITYLPHVWSLENFRDVFAKRPFERYLWNSVVVATGSTGLTVVLASWIAYRLRLRPLQAALRFQRWLLVVAITPPTLLVIPLFLIVRYLDLVNRYPGLILAYVLLNVPFAVWMLHAGFRRIPIELVHAARMDGLREWSILGRIIWPLSRPAIAVTAILVFIFCWNEFLIALTVLPSPERYTVPVGIAMLSGASVYEIPWGQINGAVTITTVPVILLIAAFQRWILEGLTAGAVRQ